MRMSIRLQSVSICKTAPSSLHLRFQSVENVHCVISKTRLDPVWIVGAKQFHWLARSAVVYFGQAHSQAHMGLVTRSFTSPTSPRDWLISLVKL